MITYILYKLIRKMQGFEYFKTYEGFKQMKEGIENGTTYYDEYGGINNIIFR